ncbi:MAG TPA: hypothetical protein PKU91_09385, partial [Phycisphaerales bacterium]|nr:hypothetical protein [Phycisphaerales bacterium]
IHPWQHLGITRYWLDWSNHLWDAYEEFPYSPLYRPGTDEHHFLGAESIPSVPVAQGVYEIDIPKVLLSPAIALNTMPTVNAQKQWDISAYAGSTELMALLDHSEDDYFKINHMFDVLSWAQKGFVLACQGVESIGAQPEGVSAKRMIEFMKRVYDFGPLADARDFNGDGVANQQDFNDFMLVYNLYLGRTNCNWVHGDVNGDNTVNMSDYQIFRARAMMTSAVPINLGSAEPYDALTKP